MRYYATALIAAALAAHISAHGVITEIQGANGVNMPGLSILDGTPRDCGSPFCGSEDDTSVIRAREMGGRSTALGRTPKGGPVDASRAIATFMNGMAKRDLHQLEKRQRTPRGTKENRVSRMAGMGSVYGLPTASDDGVITMTYHQVNQDGAGPLGAQIDSTSGGTDPAAFQPAKVIQNVPGALGGLSLAAVMDWPVKVQVPPGTKCTGSAGGAQNVCVVRLSNNALAGPFGGSAAFTM